MNNLGKVFMTMGVILFVLGMLWHFVGKLPGDIVFKKGNTTFYFPIVTSVVISVILSLLFYILGKFR